MNNSNRQQRHSVNKRELEELALSLKLKIFNINDIEFIMKIFQEKELIIISGSGKKYFNNVILQCILKNKKLFSKVLSTQEKIKEEDFMSFVNKREFNIKLKEFDKSDKYDYQNFIGDNIKELFFSINKNADSLSEFIGLDMVFKLINSKCKEIDKSDRPQTPDKETDKSDKFTIEILELLEFTFRFSVFHKETDKFFSKIDNNINLDNSDFIKILFSLDNINKRYGFPAFENDKTKISEKDYKIEIEFIQWNQTESEYQPFGTQEFHIKLDTNSKAWDAIIAIMIAQDINIDLYEVSYKKKVEIKNQKKEEVKENKLDKEDYVNTTINTISFVAGELKLILKNLQKDVKGYGKIYFQDSKFENFRNPIKKLIDFWIEKNKKIKRDEVFSFVTKKTKNKFLDNYLESIFSKEKVIGSVLFLERIKKVAKEKKETAHFVFLHLLIGFEKGDINEPYLRNFDISLTFRHSISVTKEDRLKSFSTVYFENKEKLYDTIIAYSECSQGISQNIKADFREKVKKELSYKLAYLITLMYISSKVENKGPKEVCKEKKLFNLLSKVENNCRSLKIVSQKLKDEVKKTYGDVNSSEKLLGKIEIKEKEEKIASKKFEIVQSFVKNNFSILELDLNKAFSNFIEEVMKDKKNFIRSKIFISLCTNFDPKENFEIMKTFLLICCNQKAEILLNNFGSDKDVIDFFESLLNYFIENRECQTKPFFLKNEKDSQTIYDLLFVIFSVAINYSEKENSIKVNGIIEKIFYFLGFYFPEICANEIDRFKPFKDGIFSKPANVKLSFNYLMIKIEDIFQEKIFLKLTRKYDSEATILIYFLYLHRNLIKFDEDKEKESLKELSEAFSMIKSNKDEEYLKKNKCNNIFISGYVKFVERQNEMKNCKFLVKSKNEPFEDLVLQGYIKKEGNTFYILILKNYENNIWYNANKKKEFLGFENALDGLKAGDDNSNYYIFIKKEGSYLNKILKETGEYDDLNKILKEIGEYDDKRIIIYFILELIKLRPKELLSNYGFLIKFLKDNQVLQAKFCDYMNIYLTKDILKQFQKEYPTGLENLSRVLRSFEGGTERPSNYDNLKKKIDKYNSN